MRLPQSKHGMILSGIYIAVSVYLILTQGLFGESFIALILGFPWTFILAMTGAYEAISNLHEWVIMTSVILPMVLNAVLIYFIGKRRENKKHI